MNVLCMLVILSYGVVFGENISELKQPNIIIIIADDVGWNDFSFHGSNQIPTPNIDALAYNGVIMNKFYTHHACTPSRTALLTGTHPIKLGMQGTPIPAGSKRALPKTTTTLAQALKKLNYSTHLVGKWHLGAAHKDDLPTRKGFDTHFGYWHGFVGYFNYIQAQKAYGTDTMLRGLDLHNDFSPAYSSVGQYATDLFTEKSIDIIAQHKKDEPLFLVISHLAGHTGDNETELGVPDVEIANERFKYIKTPERRLYAEVLYQMDKSVGRIMDKLSEQNMLNNSIIVFLSDNGAPSEGMYKNFGSNWPLRGMKMTLFEGGIKGTGIFFSPRFKKQSYISNELIHITDIMPTLYYAAGGDPRDLKEVDGYNVWATLSENSPSPREEILVNIDEVLGFSAIIGERGRYKLINGSFSNGIYDKYFGESERYEELPGYKPSHILKIATNIAINRSKHNNKLTADRITEIRKNIDLSGCRQGNEDPKSCEELCLFDLEKDPCETKNIIDTIPDVAKKLKKKLHSYYKQLMPQKDRSIDLNSNPVYYNGTWCTWLDDELCPKTESDMGVIQYYLNKMYPFINV